MPKISVIIPCYNAAQYIPTLNQLWEQTTSDFELILVDVCSTDNTLELLNNFKEDHPDRAIIVTSTEHNVGCGGARNQGLKFSSGLYVMFLDCDDNYEPDLLEQMANKLDTTGADFVCCGCTITDSNTNQTTSYCIKQELVDHIKIFNEVGGARSGQLSSEVLSELLFSGVIFPSVWIKMLRRDFLINQQIYFSDIYYYEDNYWTKLLILKAQHIELINKPLYKYYQRRPGSITAERSEHSIKGLFILFSQEHQILSKAGLLPEMTLNLYNYYWGNVFHHAEYINEAPEPLRTKLLQQLWQSYREFCQTYHLPFKPHDLSIRSYFPLYKLIPKIKIFKAKRSALKKEYRTRAMLCQYQTQIATMMTN